ncbi:hypothetical protein ES703_08814 [subsurface metagenome]
MAVIIKCQNGVKRMSSEDKIITFIEANGGRVTNSLIREKHFGDGEIGNKTTSVMRRMADEGKLKLKITHNNYTTTIEWLLPEVENKK